MTIPRMIRSGMPYKPGRRFGNRCEGLAHADRESKPCYLETSERRNLAFYERLGLVVLEEAILGKGGPKVWAMRREPRPATA